MASHQGGTKQAAAWDVFCVINWNPVVSLMQNEPHLENISG